MESQGKKIKQQHKTNILKKEKKKENSNQRTGIDFVEKKKKTKIKKLKFQSNKGVLI